VRSQSLKFHPNGSDDEQSLERIHTFNLKQNKNSFDNATPFKIYQSTIEDEYDSNRKLANSNSLKFVLERQDFGP